MFFKKRIVELESLVEEQKKLLEAIRGGFNSNSRERIREYERVSNLAGVVETHDRVLSDLSMTMKALLEHLNLKPEKQWTQDKTWGADIVIKDGRRKVTEHQVEIVKLKKLDNKK